MITKWPSSCVGAVSSVYRGRSAGLRLTSISSIAHRRTRPYATSKKEQKSDDLTRPEKAALVEIQGLHKGDSINPPRSTLPPPLKLPEQGDANVALYYLRVGRAYGSFYWAGIKAVWFNYQAAKILKERLKKNGPLDQSILTSIQQDSMTRAQFQLLERNNYDIGKLPFFGLLVVCFGEWLPLIVPFIPGAVPGTCRIPQQTEGMRKKAEERRRAVFRSGIKEPGEEQMGKDVQSEGQAWPLTRRERAVELLGHMRDEQLLHLSSTLNLHSRVWDRLQLAPPSSLLRRGVAKHLTYLARDDMLLSRHRSAAKALATDEVHMACEERGLDVLGKREESLRTNLRDWLERQRKDQGRGSALLKMLFRRPNAWDTMKNS